MTVGRLLDDWTTIFVYKNFIIIDCSIQNSQLFLNRGLNYHALE
jgi:hypothetical protein